MLVVLGSGWTPAADRFGDDHRRGADRRAARGSRTSAWPGHAGVLRSVRGRRRPADPRPPRPRARLRGPRPRRGRARGARGGAGRLRHGGGHQRGRRAPRRACTSGQPVLISDHINLTGRSPLTGPDAPAELGLAAVRRPHRGLLAPAPRPGPRDRPHAARRACTPGVPGPAVRDARRDPHAADPRRRPGRHEHRARGDRGSPRRRRGARAVAGHQPGRRAGRRRPRPRRRPRRRAGRPPRRWATSSPGWSPRFERRRAAGPGAGVARRRPRPGHAGRGRRAARGRRPRRAARPLRRAGCSSAPPGCGARSARARTG